MATKNVGTGATTFQITYSLSDGCTGEVSFSSDSSWLTLDGGSSSPRTVSVAQNYGAARTGYITPTYNGSPCNDKKIQVNQSGQTVDLCATLSCDNCSGRELESTVTAFTVTWSTTASTGISSVAVNDKSSDITGSSDGTTSAQFFFGENTSENDRVLTASCTVTFSDGTTCPNRTVSFKQKKPSTSCECNSLTINGKTDIAQTGGANITIGTKTSGDACLTFGTPSVNKDWITNLSADASGNITADIGANSDSEPRTATITVPYTANTTGCSAYTFDVTQNGTSCECSSLTINKDSVTVNAGASGTVTITPRCTTVNSVSVDDQTKATAELNDDKDTITITGKASGTTTVTLNYTDGTNSCTKTISVTVNCPSYTINPSGGSGTGGQVTFSVS